MEQRSDRVKEDWRIGTLPASESLLHYSTTPTKKGHPEDSERPWEIEIDHLAPRIASLAALATRNLTTRLAGIWICSPVAGLRPMRALRFTSTNLPSPGRVKVFLAFL